jgi:DNA-binding NtrC family response regulator
MQSQTLPYLPIVHVLVDENKIYQFIFQLELKGVKTRRYANQSQLLLAIDKTAKGCVLLDLNNRSSNSLDTIALIKKQHRDLPIFAIGENLDVHTVVSAMKMGLNEVFDYPVTLNRLYNTIVQFTKFEINLY